MHRPPAASWTVKPAVWHRNGLALLALVSAVVLSIDIAMQPWGAQAYVLLTVMLCSLFGARYALANARAGTLRWDGDNWHWSGFENREVRTLVCALDFQRWILLHVTSESGASVWLWLESDARNANWLSFRRAMVSGWARETQDGSNALK